MGRAPIGKKAMTPAERQRRRRKRLRKEALSEATQGKRAAARQKARAKFMPMPVGFVYWREVTLEALERTTVLAPTTRPLAACHGDLTDDDVLALLNELHSIAESRGLDLSKLPPYPSGYHHPTAGESCTIGDAPRRKP